MNPEELNLTIKEGEGLTAELKEKYTSNIDRDIVALANSRGGVGWVGPRGKGDGQGAEDGFGEDYGVKIEVISTYLQL